MGRSKQAPDDFVCPYQHNCPHLEGSSTTFVNHELNALNQEWLHINRVVQEQSEEIAALTTEGEQMRKANALLKAKMEALHRRQFKANRRKKPDKPDAKAPRSKKRDPPVGHPPWQRPIPDHIDEIIDVPPPVVCPHCGNDDLAPFTEIIEHIQEDIVIQPRPKVTNYRHHSCFCAKCRRPVVQQAAGELLNHAIGPVARAAGLFLRYGLKIPYRGVRDFFETFYGLRMVPATVLRFDRQAASKGASIYEDLKAKLQASMVVHADETHWRENGQNGYIWYGGNSDLAVFHLATSRSSDVAVDLLGDSFSGTLITDDYAAYNAVNASSRQTCWAHLKRKAKDIRQEILLNKTTRSPAALLFCKQVMIFARLCCRLGRWQRSGRLSIKQTQSLVPRLQKRLRAFAGQPLDYEAAETLRVRITIKDYDRLFTFLTIPGVQPTNNQAEQSLRPQVIMRKISFGTRSPEGSISQGVIPSLMVTAQRQGKAPLQFFYALFTETPASAQKALFRNPPNTS